MLYEKFQKMLLDEDYLGKLVYKLIDKECNEVVKQFEATLYTQNNILRRK